MRVRKIYAALGLILIIIILIGIGFLGYRYFSERNTQSPNFSANTDSEVPQPQTPDDPFLVQMSRKLSVEESTKFRQEVQKKAEKKEFVEIKGCDPNPLVLELEGTQLKFKNSGNAPHGISFSEDDYFYVEPKSEVEIKFLRDPGPYGYSCDGGKYAKGIILVK